MSDEFGERAPDGADEHWRAAFGSAMTKIVGHGAMDVAFGAWAAPDGRRLVIESVHGARTTALQNLVVHSGTGLGGKALVLRRPVTVTDYVRAQGISHHYDEPVSLEGICSILAVPVLVSGKVTGVLYAALRQRLGIGDRMQRLGMAVVREIERTLAGLGRSSAPATKPRGRPGTERAAEVGSPDVRADLDSVIRRVADSGIRAELESIRARLSARPTAEPARSALSEREIEALRYAASGLTNAEIAHRMGLSGGTVKAYLGSVMRKLDCHNRIAAVNAARTLGYPL